MRYLVFGDVHANLDALEAVLDDAGSFDAAICLGDLVGYGPEPVACVRRIRELPRLVSLVGNHDLAALREIDLGMFNDHARIAAEWTSEQLDAESVDFLTSLDSTFDLSGVYLAHASPRNPVWEYMEEPSQGPPNFALFQQPVCFVGHTHVPRVFTATDEAATASTVTQPRASEIVSVGNSSRRIVNPGGVGQPRDGDPRAAYALYDDQSHQFEFRRAPYPIEATQRKIREAGLPEILAQRLALGV